MAQAAPARTKINTKVTQRASSRGLRPSPGTQKPGRPLKAPRVSGDARESVRQPDRPVIEMEFGILVYPPETEGEPWRATFTENGHRRFRQGTTEAKLAEKLGKRPGPRDALRPGRRRDRRRVPDRRWSAAHHSSPNSGSPRLSCAGSTPPPRPGTRAAETSWTTG